MLRGLFWLGALVGLIYVIIAWATSGPDTGSGKRRPDPERGQEQERDNPQADPSAHESKDDGPDHRRETSEGGPGIVLPQKATRLTEPVIIRQARVNPFDRQEVSTQRDGLLLFLGSEVSDPKKVEAHKLYTVHTHFIATEATRAEAEARKETIYQIKGDGRSWRRWKPVIDPIEPNKMTIIPETRYFRKLMKNDWVEEGQVLGIIDPSLVVADLDIKIRKLNASEADLNASAATKKEAHRRFVTLMDQHARAPGAVSSEEMHGAKLTYERYLEEEKSKNQAVSVARGELNATHTMLKLHEVTAKIRGQVSAIYKNRVGEAVKPGDPILQIQNPDHLEIEGLVPLEVARTLRPGAPVVIEPNQPEVPRLRLGGATDSITGVAVSRGAAPLVFAASNDHSVRVWKVRVDRSADGKESWTEEQQPSIDYRRNVVRSLACSPPKAKDNLLLVGTDAGVADLWNIDKLNDPNIDKLNGPDLKPRRLTSSHTNAITAVAFSHDGELCATGGQDRSIRLFRTESGKEIDRISRAHNGPVTSLQFTGDDRLVSAGNDRSIVLWTLKDEKLVESRRSEQRANNVDVLGVSSNSQWVLFDQGRQLRVLSLADRSIRGTIESTGTSDFSTVALFSPDKESKMVLTTSAADNRIQLWRNPVACRTGRAAELRQYIWNEGAVTSAAFAPEAPFAVTGTADKYVQVWKLPSEAEVNAPEAAAIVHSIDPFLDVGRQVRVIVEVNKKVAGLIPGGTATLVVNPQ